MKKQGTLIIACLTAAAAGVAIGMLLAPEKGETLRNNLKKSLGDWADKLTDMVTDSNGNTVHNSNSAEPPMGGVS